MQWINNCWAVTNYAIWLLLDACCRCTLAKTRYGIFIKCKESSSSSNEETVGNGWHNRKMQNKKDATQHSTTHCLPFGEAHPRSGRPPLIHFPKISRLTQRAITYTSNMRAELPKFLPRFLGCARLCETVCVRFRAYASHLLVSIRFERAFLKFKFAILRSS